MSLANAFIYAVILCCLFSASFGARNNRQSSTNYVPQQNTHGSPNADVYRHRSPICLINRVAQKNNITARYEEVKIETGATATQMPATTAKPSSFAFRLHLGNEIYRAVALTKAKAKDKVAREAYDKTKYQKPTLKERTCVENATRTIVSILYEFATVNKTMILNKEIQLEVLPPKYRVELTLDGMMASGEGRSKRVAKQEAASKIVAMLGKDNVLREITKKFDRPEYLEMGAVERLDLILYTRSEPLAKYTLNDEVGDLGSITYLSRVETETGDAVGTGKTLDESRDDAATNLLRAFGYKTKT